MFFVLICCSITATTKVSVPFSSFVTEDVYFLFFFSGLSVNISSLALRMVLALVPLSVYLNTRKRLA